MIFDWGDEMNKRGRKKLEALDKVIGKNIKLARGFRRITQTQLGKTLGLTFQQVQKYEKGANRVSALNLYKISQVLDFPLEFFYTPHKEETDEFKKDECK